MAIVATTRSPSMIGTAKVEKNLRSSFGVRSANPVLRIAASIVRMARRSPRALSSFADFG